MTKDQAIVFAIIAGMMALFVWGRLRYDLVACIALLAAVATGVVPADKAFSGFSDDIVIIVATALVLSAAVARSGLVSSAVRALTPALGTTRSQVLVLVSAVTALSAFIKNIGALAIMIPIVFRLSRSTGTAPSQILMPLSFGSLLGGLMTLVGTSPNIIVSRVRTELSGEPFRMFDFLPVGAAIAVVGVVFLAYGYRLLPAGRRGSASIETAFNIEGYTTEATVTPDSPVVDGPVGALAEFLGKDVTLQALVRAEKRHTAPSPDLELKAGDTLVLKGEPDALEQVVSRAKLKLVREDTKPDKDDATDEIGVMEAVVMTDSPIIGSTPVQIGLYERFATNLLAISRRGAQQTQRLKNTRFRAGDAVVLQGNLKLLPQVMADLGFLPLAERDIPLGRRRSGIASLVVLAAAILTLALQIFPVALVFFAAAVLLLLINAVSLNEAYDAIEWPILVMLAALIPVSDAVRTSGGTDLIAGWLSTGFEMLPSFATLGLVVAVAMAVTPFLNNAATVLVMAPIAATLATKLGYNPDPFLMAVAIGAACDFLTPIGHQCNTLVMGPGGYRFGDYSRLGLPLSLLVLVTASAVIPLVWPMVAR
ncbi:MAG: SLC13 family permease [Hyphomicrobiaceae bacterium]